MTEIQFCRKKRMYRAKTVCKRREEDEIYKWFLADEKGI